jgi:hypothetical protein
LGGGRPLGFMEAYCVKEESVRQQCEIRKCILENMDEVKEQSKDGISRVTQLVSSDKPFTILVIEHNYTIVDICQAEGL